MKNPPIAETIPFPNAAKSVFLINPLNVSNSPVTDFPIAAPPLLHLMPFIAVVMAVPVLSPNFVKSKVDTKSYSKSITALNPLHTKDPTACQSITFTAEFNPVASERPICPKSIDVKSVFANTKAVLIPSPMVVPTRDQSNAPTKPFINVPMLCAILFDVSLIFAQPMPSSAALIFSATIAPISEKSAFSHASLIIWARLANLSPTFSVSKESAGLDAPESPPLLLLSCNIFSSSIPAVAVASFFVLAVALSRLAA